MEIDVLKTFEILLDLEKDLYTPANLLFTVSRNDFQSIELQFTIQQDEKPVDLTGQTVEMAIKKPSGLVVYQPVEITEAVYGKAAARLSIQAYVEYGLHTAELYIRDIDSLAVTMPFFFASNESIMEAAEIESVNDWSALQQALFAYDLKPILVDGIPEDVLPEYVGQMAIDPIGRRIFIAYDVTATGWDLFAAGDGSGGGLIYWDNILQKPAAYPPEDHAHEITDVIGLQAALDSKANTGELGAPIDHTHEIAEVIGLQTALDSKADDQDLAAKADAADLAAKADLNHDHAITDVTGLQAALDGKAEYQDLDPFITEAEADAKYAFKGETGGIAAAWGDIAGTLANQTDLQTALNGKADDADLAAKADLNHVHTFAQITEKPAAYPPEDHDHAITDVTGLQTALDGKADDADLAAKADLNHAHAITDVTGLQAALDGKADDADLAAKADVIHRHNWDEIDQKPATYPPEAHDHPEYLTQLEADGRYALRDAEGGTIQSVDWGTITGDIATQTDLQTALNGKADDADLAAKADLNHRHNWTDLDQIPATFAPEAHNHPIAEVTGLQTALDGKADDADLTTKADLNHVHTFAQITEKPVAYPPEAHDHTIANVTGLQPALDGKADDADLAAKADLNHDHAIADVTGLQTALDGKADDADLTGKADAIHRHNWTDLDQIPATFAPEAHDHAIADVTGLQTALDGKADDADLTTKADLNHNHAIADVTGLQASLDGKADDADLAAKADLNHDHTIADVTGLQTALDAKAAIDHDHAIVDVTGLQAALDGKADDADLIPFITEAEADLKYATIDQAGTIEPHNHIITEIDGLQAELDGKADLIHTHAIADVTGLQTALDGKADDADLAAKANVADVYTTLETYTKSEVDTALAGKADDADLVPLMTEADADLKYALKGETADVNKAYVDAADNYITQTVLANLKFWKGTQSAYDLLTPDSNTLYFIIG